MSSHLFANSSPLHKASLSLIHAPLPTELDQLEDGSSSSSFLQASQAHDQRLSLKVNNRRAGESEDVCVDGGVGNRYEAEVEDDDLRKADSGEGGKTEKIESIAGRDVEEEKIENRRMGTTESVNSRFTTQSTPETQKTVGQKVDAVPNNQRLPFSLSDLLPGTTISSSPHIPNPNRNGPPSFDLDPEKGNHDQNGKEWFALVDFEKPFDVDNPKQWKMGKKWRSTAIVSAFVFISPISSSMIAPCTQQLVEKFDINSSVVSQMITSVFVLAYTVGPLVLGPLSELFGRSRVLQLANLFYLIFNFVGGFATNSAQMIVFRFLAGLGGSAPLSVGGGFISDLFHPNERGKALGFYAMGPTMGPVLGPLIGSWIAEKSTYKWVFWCSSILTAVVQGFGMILLRESYPPVILAKRAERLRKALNLPKGSPLVRTVFDKPERHWQILMRSFIRPFRLFLEPIVVVLGTYMAFIYGVIYLVLTTVYEIFIVQYNESQGIAGLNYIGLGIGFGIGTFMVSRFVDIIYNYLTAKNDGKGKPEFRLPVMVPGTISLPVGLLIFGWGAQQKVHWVLPDVGLGLIAFGMFSNFGGIQNYVIDTFGMYAASGLAAVSFLRSLCGFGFPLFAPTMYDALGYGKANTILAAAAIAIGCPAPWIFYFYGSKIRSLSKYARKADA